VTSQAARYDGHAEWYGEHVPPGALNEEAEAFPREGVAFSWEAVANAFVMLGLLPESRAEEILAEHRVIVSTLWGSRLGGGAPSRQHSLRAGGL
jgi:hypothetical protein